MFLCVYEPLSIACVQQTINTYSTLQNKHSGLNYQQLNSVVVRFKMYFDLVDFETMTGLEPIVQNIFNGILIVNILPKPCCLLLCNCWRYAYPFLVLIFILFLLKCYF